MRGPMSPLHCRSRKWGSVRHSSRSLWAPRREQAPGPGPVTSYLVEKLLRRLGAPNRTHVQAAHCPLPLRLLGAPLTVSPVPPSSLGAPLPSGMQQDLQRRGRMATPGCCREPGPIWSQAEPQGYLTAQGHMGLGLGSRARLLSRIEKPSLGPSTEVWRVAWGSRPAPRWWTVLGK